MTRTWFATKSIDTVKAWYFIGLKADLHLKLGHRYVAENHVCLVCESLIKSHSHFNFIYLQSKYISQSEKDGSAAFLDTKTRRNPDTMVQSNPVLKDKGTHADTYFYFHFFPRLSSPSSIFSSGANSIPSTKAVKIHFKNNDNADQFIECVYETSPEILKSKTKEPLKVLSSSDISGTKFISVYNFSAQWRPLFGNQRTLNFGVMAVREMKPRSRLSKNIHLSRDFLAILGGKVVEKVLV